MLENQDREPQLFGRMVLVEGWVFLWKHLTHYVINATTRNSLGSTRVNALFWSTQWSTRFWYPTEANVR